MARIARIQAPYCVHHLIVRFVNGEKRFDDRPGARQVISGISDKRDKRGGALFFWFSFNPTEFILRRYKITKKSATPLTNAVSVPIFSFRIP
jgi:hypothetical protein